VADERDDLAGGKEGFDQLDRVLVFQTDRALATRIEAGA
jgi:hypothetical protein